MIIRNAVPPMILATILGFASAIAADAKPITEAEKKHCASCRAFPFKCLYRCAYRGWRSFTS